jgi:hypothetical protein
MGDRKGGWEDMSENEFEHDGKKYRAVEAYGLDCAECAFLLPLSCDCDTNAGFKKPSCMGKDRADHRNVIFLEVKP